MSARAFFGRSNPIIVTVSPSTASGTVAVSPPGNPTELVTSSSVTASAAGGSGSYTFSWARISGSTLVSANNSTSATTAFSGVIPLNTTQTAVFRCTVTDSLGETGTFDVTVQLQYNDSL